MSPLDHPREAASDRFSLDPDAAHSIPVHLYFDPAVYEREKRAIFWKSWVLAGHASEVREPGSYITTAFTGQRLFVIRNAGGDLKAFFNVCQHRGHSLLKGRGTARKLILCPYHAWAYDHDGALVAANNCTVVSGFEKDDYGLPEVQVEEFCGFVFVNLDPDAPPMREIYPGAEAALRRFCAAPEALEPGDLFSSEIKANWKAVGDNRMECYHCATAHKDFVDLVDMHSYQVELHDKWSLQWGTCREENSAYSFTEADGPNIFATIYLWPSTALTVLPGMKGLGIVSAVPSSPETTHQDFWYCRPGPEMTPLETRMMTYLEEIISPEDVALVEDVQQGVRSLGFRQGRIMVDKTRSGISEHALHHFQSLVLDALAEGV